MKIFGLSIRILVVLLTIPLILITANSAFTGLNPPLPGERTKGPIVSGEILIVPDPDDTPPNPSSDVYFSFIGKCKGKDVVVPLTLFSGPSFADVNETTLLNNRWDLSDLPPGCAPDQAIELITRKVKNYVDMSPADLIKQAEIYLIFVY
jgi:hypothetical protein